MLWTPNLTTSRHRSGAKAAEREIAVQTRLLFEGAPGTRGLCFEDPSRVIEAYTLDDVAGALAEADRERAQGRWLAGFLAYEAGYAFEPRLARIMPHTKGPLLRFGVFTAPRDTGFGLQRADRHLEPTLTVSIAAPEQRAYREAVARAIELIEAGDVYQANISLKADVTAHGSADTLYARLRRAQPARASAFLQFPDLCVLSLSPELFFRVDDGIIRTRPMKGTAARGRWAADDRQAARALRDDPKQRAENLMIVDLLRNDMARVCQPGSVRVSDLFTVETHARFHTMTSGVMGQLLPGAGLEAIMRALFPCGSVTGAPKIRAMEIIQDLESGPRGLYCGAIGFAGPDRMAFNVAIRTLTVTSGPEALIAYRAGAGIVADSEPMAEYEECLLKSRFLTDDAGSAGAVTLFETLRWERHMGFALLDEHLERLASSAAALGFAYDELAVLAALEAAVSRFHGELARVRIDLSKTGRLEARVSALEESPGPWRFVLWEEPIDAKQSWLYHKTSGRALYDAALAKASQQWGADEVLFTNTQGVLTEGSRSTLFLQQGGLLWTPRLMDGVLPGVLRTVLLERHGTLVREARLTLADLERAEAIWFGNSLRGLKRGELLHVQRQTV